MKITVLYYPSLLAMNATQLDLEALSMNGKLWWLPLREQVFAALAEQQLLQDKDLAKV